jgi:predicted metal-dependent HD superfamily phosphohydrolase
MSHLDHLIAELYPLKNQIEDWQTVVLSVAYHDIVYNPLKKDNEVRSASIAVDRLNKLNVSVDRREKCREQILSTRMHAASENPDTNYFTDADLSILGADAELYLEYSHRVRKEYKYFPDLLYKPGRKKVLMRFLAMINIFKTKYFQDNYEAQARFNLTNELNSLG